MLLSLMLQIWEEAKKNGVEKDDPKLNDALVSGLKGHLAKIDQEQERLRRAEEAARMEEGRKRREAEAEERRRAEAKAAREAEEARLREEARKAEEERRRHAQEQSRREAEEEKQRIAKRIREVIQRGEGLTWLDDQAGVIEAPSVTRVVIMQRNLS